MLELHSSFEDQRVKKRSMGVWRPLETLFGGSGSRGRKHTLGPLACEGMRASIHLQMIFPTAYKGMFD